MGYYSAEMFSSTRSGFEKLKDFLKEESKDVKYPLSKFETEIDTGNGMIFGWDRIKWYGSEIDAFERAWNRFVKEGYPWTRIRIGEETGDVDEQYSKLAWEVDIPRLFVTCSWDYE